MSAVSAELLAAITRQGRKVDQGGQQSVPREESPASVFRSGWSRPPRVPAPRSASPAGSQTSSCCGQPQVPLPRSSSSACSQTSSCKGQPQVPAPRSASPAGSQTSTRSGQSTSHSTVNQGSAIQRSGSAPSSSRSCSGVAGHAPAPRNALPSHALPSTPPSIRAGRSGIPLRGRTMSNASGDSDRTSSAGSNASPAHMPTRVTRDSTTPSLHLEGWLSKRSSHKMAGGVAARWQSRYWTLQGCTLRYHKQCGSPAIRSFDLRRMKSIQIPPQGPLESWMGQPRELELDFGFRLWRLRAENAETARRWLCMLDAARLVAGEPVGDDPDDAAGNLSDEGSMSSSSSVRSSASSAALAALVLPREASAERGLQGSGGGMASSSGPERGQDRASVTRCRHSAADKLSSGSTAAPDTGLTHSPDVGSGNGQTEGHCCARPAPDGGPRRASPSARSHHAAADKLSPRFGLDDSCSPCDRSSHFGSHELVSDKAADADESSAGLCPGSATLSARARGLLPSSIKGILPQSHLADPIEAAPKPKPKPKAPQFLPAAAVADRLEIDPDSLDKRFKDWLGGVSNGNDTPHFGDDGGGDGGAAVTRGGLSEALAGMWMALGGEGVDGALAAWRGPQLPEPQAFADGVEGILSEYLSRMLRRLEHWVQECDPSSDEMADVATWFLFQAMPELDLFESKAEKELKSKPSRAWRTTAEQLEVLLLGEWETRSCDEIHQHVEELYAPGSTFQGEAASRDQSRVNALLEILRPTLQGKIWHGHARACDRAALVLIAALNAVLRFYRSHVQALLDLPSVGAGGGACSSALVEGRAKRQLSRMLSRISCAVEERVGAIASAPTAAAAAAEAATLARFCREAHAGRTPVAQSGVCSDVLLAFASAFDREGGRVCAFMAETHFAETRRQTLKEISYARREVTQQSLLAGACEAARGFLDETIDGRSAAAAPQVCDAVIRIIVQYWVRAFRKAPPRLSSTTVSSITADEAVLRQLAVRFGAEAMWVSLQSSDDPLQPLREVRLMLSSPSPETVNLGAERLEVVLGVERGAALASAVRLTIAR